MNYRLLNRNKKIQAFDNLFKKLSLIDNINTNYPEDFKLLMQKLNEYLSHWNNSVEAIRKHFDEIAMNYSGKSGLSQELVLFLQDFDQLMLGIQNFKNDLTLFDEYECLIKPLDNIIKKHNKIPLILSLINHRLEAILAYENYNNLINAYADKFEDNSKKFSEASKIIRSALNDLK